jgi:hypothetical protein
MLGFLTDHGRVRNEGEVNRNGVEVRNELLRRTDAKADFTIRRVLLAVAVPFMNLRVGGGGRGENIRVDMRDRDYRDGDAVDKQGHHDEQFGYAAVTDHLQAVI